MSGLNFARKVLLVCMLYLVLVVSRGNKDSGRDFYKILDVSRSATGPEIKKAFRQMSLKYHPDKNQDDPDAIDKFTDVNAAYECLSDPEKRRKYDQGGEDALNQPEQQHHDPFAHFFGHGQQQEQTGPSINLKIRATLEEIYTGKEYELAYNRKVICPHCRGSGADDPSHVKTCNKCGGSGQIITKKQIMPGFVQQFAEQCPKCGGEGKTLTSTCHQCHGDKLVDSLDSLRLFIEKGTPDGHKIEYRDAADELINVRAGQVNVKVEELPHRVFQRVKNDLKVHMEISLRDALLGFEQEIVHLDGHTVKVDRLGQTTKPGLVNRFKGEGMPIFGEYGDYGDMLVTYVVKFPEVITPDQKLLLKELFNA